MISTAATTCFLCLLAIIPASASVPTAEEYAHALEARFLGGESAASIRSSFETNELYSITEILPYCYDYTVDTNDIEESISRYKAKLAFIGAIMPRDYLEFSSEVIEKTSVRLDIEHGKLMRHIRRILSESTLPDVKTYWTQVYPRAVLGAYSGFADVAVTLHDARIFTKSLDMYLRKFAFHPPQNSYGYILNLDSYADVFTRAELYAELSTNTQYNADAMFRYCLTEKGDFATNNIAIAEKQIWRNNFVLEIVRHSCNLHTNAANRALDTAYTNKLAAIRAHYDAIPEPHLGMEGGELEAWRVRLRRTIEAYTGAISPFQTVEGR